MTSATDAAISASHMDLLRALGADIREEIGPEVTSPMAKMLVAMAGDIIAIASHDAADLQAINLDYIAQRKAVLTDLLTLAGDGGIKGPVVEDAAAALAAPVPQVDVTATLQALDGAIERLLDAVSASASAASADAAALDAIGRRLIATSLAQEDRLVASRAQQLAALSQAREEVRATVTVEKLQAYWRHRFPDRPNATVTSMKELSGGFSKTTILFEVVDWEDKPASLVLRRDLRGGATDKSVVNEYHIIETAFRKGIVAPEPILLETAPDRLDRPFMVTRRSEGVPAGDLWKTSAESTRQTAIDLARTLGRLHGMALSEFGTAPTVDPLAHVTAYLDDLEQSWYRLRREPEPAMKASIEWLKRNMPTPQRLCFVHGDPGAWNLLTSDGRLSALLDWELWHFGDAIEDVSYVKGFAESLMPWEEFLAEYKAAGGVDYDPVAGEYYDIFRDVRNAIFSIFAGNAFRTGRNPEMRMAHCEERSYKMLLLRGAKLIAGEA